MVVLDLYCEAAPVWDKTGGLSRQAVGLVHHPQLRRPRRACTADLPQILQNLQTAAHESRTRRLARCGHDHGRVRLQPGCLRSADRHDLARRSPGLDTWLADFVLRRYGKRVETADQAWEMLRRTVYQLPGYSGSVIFSRPSLQASQPIPYDTVQLAEACDLLLSSADELSAVDTYQFDVVHLIRQVLGDLAQTMYMDVVDAYAAAGP